MGVTINDFVRYRELRTDCRKRARQIENLDHVGSQAAAREKVKGSLPYFPYTEQRVPVAGIVNNVARIAAKKDELNELLEQAAKLYERLAAFLPSVDNVEVRETLELYYIDGLTYNEVAEALGVDGDGSPQMQKAHKYMRERLPKLNAHVENVKNEF